MAGVGDDEETLWTLIHGGGVVDHLTEEAAALQENQYRFLRATEEQAEKDATVVDLWMAPLRRPPRQIRNDTTQGQPFFSGEEARTGRESDSDVILVQTPTGLTILSKDQWTEQQNLYLQAQTHLGGFLGACSLVEWLQRYGLLSTESPLGSHVHVGLIKYDLPRYFASKNGKHMRELPSRVGWFLAPAAFSKEAAQLPRRREDTQWYPAVFWGAGVSVLDSTFTGYAGTLSTVETQWIQDIYGACFAIQRGESKSWFMHPSRVFLELVTVANLQQYPDFED